MRPYAVKRSRTGKYRVRRNPRYRPVKLSKKDKKVVQVAVRRATRRSETKIDGVRWVHTFAVPTSVYTGSNREHTTQYIEAVYAPNQGIADNQIIGSEIFLKMLTFDAVFSKGHQADGTINPHGMYIRVDLISVPQNLDDGLGGGWKDNWLQQHPLWDAEYNPHNSAIAWVPSGHLDRRWVTRYRTKIIYLPPTAGAHTAGGTGVTSNAQARKRIKITYRVNKKHRFEDFVVNQTIELSKAKNYYWVVSGWQADGYPGSFDADASVFHTHGNNRFIYTDS